MLYVQRVYAAVHTLCAGVRIPEAAAQGSRSKSEYDDVLLLTAISWGFRRSALACASGARGAASSACQVQLPASYALSTLVSKLDWGNIP
jgi:hypothetical protein